MIVNNKVIKYLEISLNKNYKDIQLEDLIMIESLCISEIGSGYTNDRVKINLSQFRKLQRLYITDSIITKEVLEFISQSSNITHIEFKHCLFENNLNFDLLKNIDILVFNNCNINDYSFVNKLENVSTLEIVYPYNDVVIDIDQFKNLVKLKKLFLEGCIIEKTNSFSKMEKLELLYLMSTEINENISLKDMPNLKKIYVSPKYKNFIQDNGEINVLTNNIDMAIDDSENSKRIV